MDDDEVDEVLAELRHRDAIRVLVVSSAFALVFIGATFVWPGYPSWAAGFVGVCILGVIAPALYLRRERLERLKHANTPCRGHPDS